MKLSRLFVSKRTADNIKEMYRRPEAQKRIRSLGYKRVRMFAAIFLVALVAATPVFVADALSMKDPVNSLKRNEYEQGERNVSLLARTDDGNEEKIAVNVSPRQLSERETEELSKELDEKLWTVVLGDNRDADNVVSDLDFPKHIEGFPFKIAIRSDSPMLINSRGEINRDELKKEDTEGNGIPVCLRATITYKDHSEDKYLYIVLRRADDSESDSIRSRIENAITCCDEMSLENTDQILPEKIGDQNVVFYSTAVNKGFVVLLIGIIIPFILIAKKDDEIKKEADDRRKQIDLDHARILNQYALYHIAGMNPRAIWTAICDSYEKRLKESGTKRRYAYDEMLVTKKMMDDGMGELTAYDDHADRLGSIRYRSFISLIKQAVVNGGANLSEMLYEETDKAQRDRMASVRLEASEAQTKLLLPMFMMLLTVLVYVMVPALIGLNE